MVLNLRLCAALFLSISSCAYCDLVTALNPITQPTPFSDSNAITSVNWCECQFLAVGGFDDNGGLLGVYQFDQSGEALSLTVTATLGIGVNSVAWCSTCSFLAAGGQDYNFTAIIQIYSFDPTNPGNLETVGTKTTLGGRNVSITALDWCSGCSFLAAGTTGAFSFPFGTPGVLQVYGFDPHAGLVRLASESFNNDSVDNVKWCSNCSYLAITISQSSDPRSNSTLSIWSFNVANPNNLVQGPFLSTDRHYTTIDWCGTCSYIAAGGIIGESGVVDIIHFDGSSLTSVTTVSLSPGEQSNVYSVVWCQECDNIAVVGSVNSLNVLQLYHFDSTTGTLSPVQTYDLTFVPSVVDWCSDTCNYLAIGGANDVNGLIQLFKSTFSSPAPTNLTAQKICHRFPTQIDIINQLCWNAVTGAVEYNVYADAALSIKLATITEPPLCYSQHQICAGRSTTYYVTAVDANGTESVPAVVTV